MINTGPHYNVTLFFSSLLLWNIPTFCPPPYHDMLYPTPLHPLTLLLPLLCQMKCIYGTCAGKTVSWRRPSNFIFKMPAINLSNGLNRIGVTRSAIRHGLSLRGLWAYLSQPKTSAGRRKRLSVERGGGGPGRRETRWMYWRNMLRAKMCAHIFMCLDAYAQAWMSLCMSVDVCVCAEVNANSSTHWSLTLESQLSTLAVNVPA